MSPVRRGARPPRPTLRRGGASESDRQPHHLASCRVRIRRPRHVAERRGCAARGGRPSSAAWGRRGTLGVLGVGVLATLGGFVGVQTSTATAASDGWTLTLHYPRVARAGLDVEWQWRGMLISGCGAPRSARTWTWSTAPPHRSAERVRSGPVCSSPRTPVTSRHACLRSCVTYEHRRWRCVPTSPCSRPDGAEPPRSRRP
jgi:hypothetical protein